MGKNLKDYESQFEPLKNPCAEINLGDYEQSVLHHKKRGRKKMIEKFFYNPRNEEISEFFTSSDAHVGEIITLQYAGLVSKYEILEVLGFGKITVKEISYDRI